MPTVEATGTVLADGTEQTLATISTNRNLMLVVNLTNMQAGDTVVLKVKRKVVTLGSLVTYATQTFSGVQSDPAAISIPFPSPIQAAATLQQTAGGMRNYEYSVESI